MNYMWLLKGLKPNHEFDVYVQEKRLILPNNETVLEAICTPLQPSEKGISYKYDWTAEDWTIDDYCPFVIVKGQDENKLILSNLEEGVHEFKVEVSYCMRNNHDYRNDVVKAISAKVIVESGITVLFICILHIL